MSLRTPAFTFTAIALAACAPESSQDSAPLPATIQMYVAALNDRDEETLLRLVSPNIEWVEIGKDGSAVHAENGGQYEEGLFGYFEWRTTQILLADEWMGSGNLVTTRQTYETILPDKSVTTKEVLVVYELTDDQRISRIWEYSGRTFDADRPPFLEF